MPRNRRADRVKIETLALDGASVQALVDQNLRTGLLGEAGIQQSLETEQLSLLQARPGKRREQRLLVPSECRLVGVLAYPSRHFEGGESLHI